VRRVHDALRLGGAFIVCEKVIAADPHLDREFIDRYFDFKRRNGYSEQEIRRKEEALDGVLIPLTFDANLALLKDAGFRTVESFFRWFNFAAFLCLK
jgi:tRNA (cmo5U34)-methyltransferase